MKPIPVVMRIFLAALMCVWSPLSMGDGDAARGSTLYHSTYLCIDCHSANPGPGNIIAAGATVSGLTSAIQSVAPMRSRFLSTLGQNPTDLADIAAYIASVASALPDLNQHGLSGSWYEPATSGQGFELEFFPNLVAPGTAFVQGAWFSFDVSPAGVADRQRWYTFAGNAQSTQSNVPIQIFQNVGGNFAAPPITSAAVVGSGTLTFSQCDSGTFTYAFTDGSGRTGTIPLTRITPNVTCTVQGDATTDADFSLSGNWYDPATSGQGLVFELNPRVPVFFFAWYTYAPAGQSSGAAGQRWFTGQGSYTPGSRSITVTMFETTGGVFDQPTPAAQTTVAVGTATVTFTSCTTAQLQFNFTGGSNAGRSGAIALSRVGPVPAGCGP